MYSFMYAITFNIYNLFSNITDTVEKINHGCEIPDDWAFTAIFVLIELLNIVISTLHSWPKFRNLSNDPPECYHYIHYLILCQIASAVITPLSFIFFIPYLAQLVSVAILCLMLWNTLYMIRHQFGKLIYGQTEENFYFKMWSTIFINLITFLHIAIIVYELITNSQQSMFILISVCLTFINLILFFINKGLSNISIPMDGYVYEWAKTSSSHINEFSAVMSIRMFIIIFTTIQWIFEITCALYFVENKQIACRVLYCVKILPFVLTFIITWFVKNRKIIKCNMFFNCFKKKSNTPEVTNENIDLAIISCNEVVEEVIEKVVKEVVERKINKCKINKK